MLLLHLLLSLLFVASVIAAVAACISDTCVSCPSPLLWLKPLLLTMKLMMVVLALVLMTSRAHSCAARSCDPSVSPWGSKEIAREYQNYDLSLVWTRTPLKLHLKSSQESHESATGQPKRPKWSPKGCQDGPQSAKVAPKDPSREPKGRPKASKIDLRTHVGTLGK